MKHKEIVLVLDFGSQYNQLIARRIREKRVYSRIVPHNITPLQIQSIAPKGLIFSGGPASVYGKRVPKPHKGIYSLGIPILGICYGMQIMAKQLGGRVKRAGKREYGHTALSIDSKKGIFRGLPKRIACWMSHGDSISRLPKGFERIAHTSSTKAAAMADRKRGLFGVQFHPEVAHTQRGGKILENFLKEACGCKGNWTMKSFIADSIESIREKAGREKVVLGLSGGVDSSVTAALLNRAIGRSLYCIFVDNGLLRKGERELVKRRLGRYMKLNLKVVDARARFLKRLKGVMDPEKKRRIIGNEFIKVFERAAKRLGEIKFLAQGTLYPDVIESTSAFGGPSATIKTHHNVGGLPKKMRLELIEPLRDLFKDEVRLLGRQLGLRDEIVQRQPFPGPGLAVRIIGDVTAERLRILKDADEIVIDEIKKAGLYDKLWQSFAVLLPVKTVGVMGDERTYDNVIAVRAVTSADAMTADWAKLDYALLGRMANRIINEVEGVNRVAYDISSKPPATIEWE